MLLTAILLWSLNLTVTRYILTHGFQPLAYSAVRYGLAAVVFVAMTVAVERSLRVAGRRDRKLIAVAILALVVNQVCFVYALKTTTASTIALILGATPIITALLGLVLRTETLSQKFWYGGAVSFAGVALVAAGASGGLSSDVGGILFGLATAATWGVYSIAITPLMTHVSPSRVSAIALSIAWIPIVLLAAPQLESQDWDLGWEVWALLVFATLGPLVLTNVLWFRSLHRIGPSRATLAANLQPFVAAVVALVLLDEPLTALQVAGGILIAIGILLARGFRRASPPRLE